MGPRSHKQSAAWVDFKTGTRWIAGALIAALSIAILVPATSVAVIVPVRTETSPEWGDGKFAIDRYPPPAFNFYF